MKKILIILGLLLAPSVHAQDANLPEPLSPYVRQILERADRIERNYLPGLSASGYCDAERSNAVDNALVDTRAQINATLSRIAQADDLTNVTVCQRYDLDIIERKLEQIRELMIDVTRSCELSTLRALGLVHVMLAKAYEAVLFGGLSPAYADYQLRGSFLGDEGDPAAQVCPFSSDYAPPSLADIDESGIWPTIRSMGCDSETLEFILSQDIPDARRQEAEQAHAFLTNVEDVAADVGGQILAFEEAFRRVFAIVRGDRFPPPVNPERPPHEVIAGCRALVIEDDPDGDGTLSPNPSLAETWDDDSLPPGFLLKSTADPFSMFRAPIDLITSFVRLRSDRGLMRPFDSTGGSDVFTAVTHAIRELYFKNTAVNMEREGAAVDALSRDGQLRMFAAVAPLRTAVRSFGEVASFPPAGEERPVLQTYIRDLALFLRRSCVWGACNETLNGVLKRVLNENCYPYGSGCFRNEGYLKKCYENTETEC